MPVQAIDEPTQLAGRHRQSLLVFGIPGPVKSALFKAPAMQPESIGIPMQDLDSVAAAIAKYKPVRADRIEP